MPTSAPINVRDVAIVHQTFRSAFTESATLVRPNPVPTAKRVSSWQITSTSSWECSTTTTRARTRCCSRYFSAVHLTTPTAHRSRRTCRYR